MPVVDADRAEVTVIMVNFNTRDITIRAIETLLENAGNVTMHVVVWDNDSHDGSADEIAARFPEVSLVRHPENIGFAKANNLVAAEAKSEYLLLLNSDTEVHPGAVEKLLEFGKKHPEAGIVGGKTYFPDGTLNPTSCWNRMTPWSLLCQAIGLSRIFSKSLVFNWEGIGGWQRDTEREVDIVTGCFFLLRTELWKELGGFHPRYFMYGEEVDMCLRAKELGYRPMITPKAQIMHMGGASAVQRGSKLIQLMRAKASLVKDHWERSLVPLGLGLLWLWIAIRLVAARLNKRVRGKETANAAAWQELWAKREDWLKGY